MLEVREIDKAFQNKTRPNIELPVMTQYSVNCYVRPYNAMTSFQSLHTSCLREEEGHVSFASLRCYL